ncbi:MAG TPA: glycosyltransferase [Bellilinea sp.]|nr:glycosyltransferase [Bellilinea sp.]
MILVVVPHPISRLGYMRSQVVGQFAFLSSIDLDVAIFSEGSSHDKDVELFSLDLSAKGLRGYFVESSDYSLIRYARSILKLVSLIRSIQPEVIYAREVWGALIALVARLLSGINTLKIVYDVRGAVPEEIAFTDLSWRGGCKSLFFSLLERLVVVNATMLNAVTENLSSHILNKYGRRANVIIPCCVESVPLLDDASRVSLRKKFGFGETETVYAYSGGLSRWQLFEDTIELFARISAIDAEARLLVITPERDRALALLSNKVSSMKYQVISVRQEEVAFFLHACDVAFLLRENNVVNRVAFPIKFAEYLSAGLPVVVTDGVAEITSIVQRENLGLVVSLQDEDVFRVCEWARIVTIAREEWRERARSYATEHLLWSCHRKSFEVLYG